MTIKAIANIRKLFIKQITGKSKIIINVLDKTITGKASIRKASFKTISGKASIAKISTKTIKSISRIQQINKKNIFGISNIRNKIPELINSVSRIQQRNFKSIIGKANVRNTTVETINAKSRVQIPSTETISGKSKILKYYFTYKIKAVPQSTRYDAFLISTDFPSSLCIFVGRYNSYLEAYGGLKACMLFNPCSLNN